MLPPLKDLKVGMKFKSFDKDSFILIISKVDYNTGSVSYKFQSPLLDHAPYASREFVTFYPDNWNNWDLVYEVEGFEV